jgi:hypothetical protein
MSEDQAKPAVNKNSIGMALAVLLTLAIVVVVFWQQHPGGDAREPDPRGPPDARPPSGLEEMGDGAWRAYYGPAVVEVTGNPAREFNFRMRLFAVIDEDTRTLIRAQRMLVQDANAAKNIGLSDEQVEQLKTIDPPRMVIADADRQHVIELWHKWEKAKPDEKPAAQNAIVDSLREIAQKTIEPTKKAWTDAAESVKKTLTLQQMAKLAVYQETNPQQPWAGGFGGSSTTQRGRP